MKKLKDITIAEALTLMLLYISLTNNGILSGWEIMSPLIIQTIATLLVEAFKKPNKE